MTHFVPQLLIYNRFVNNGKKKKNSVSTSQATNFSVTHKIVVIINVVLEVLLA